MVMVWLGESDEDTVTAFYALIVGMSKRYKIVPQLLSGEGLENIHLALSPETPLARTAVAKLSQNPYFSRTWIVQEIMCAGGRIMLQSGSQLIATFDSLLPFSAAGKGEIQTESSQVSGGLNCYTESLLHGIQMYAQPSEPLLREGKVALNAFGTSILDYQHTQCSDPRDKIFALLGTPKARRADSLRRFKPDYSMTLDEVAVATSSCVDQLESSAFEGQQGVFGWNIVKSCLGVRCTCEAFRSWVQGRLFRDEAQGVDAIRVASGRVNDCSGVTFRVCSVGNRFLSCRSCQQKQGAL